MFKPPKNTKLPQVVVWSVSYNTSTSGPNPLGGSGQPQDSLNVGLNPKATTGLNRTEQSIFWDTRIPGNTCAMWRGRPLSPAATRAADAWRKHR